MGPESSRIPLRELATDSHAMRRVNLWPIHATLLRGGRGAVEVSPCLRASSEAGGKNPRVDAINVDSAERWKVIDFPQNHSAYAMDIDSEDGTFVVGTKGGFIYLIYNVYNRETHEQINIRKMVQGLNRLVRKNIPRSV